MNLKNTKVSSLILMEVLGEEISKIIESEIDKGEYGDYVTVDLLVELYEVLGIASERLGMDIV